MSLHQEIDSLPMVGCGKRFFKIMVLEIASEEAVTLDKFNVELLFSSSQNNRH